MKPTFKLDLNAPDNFRPLSDYRCPKIPVMLPEVYAAYEPNFYTTIETCAAFLGKIRSYEKRLRLDQELSRVFIHRCNYSATRLLLKIEKEVTKHES
jgi:hypothetical protein